MDISTIEPRLKYITNATGDKTEVIVPVEIWEAVIKLLPDDNESGLDPVDEYESKQSLLVDLRESLAQVAAGQTHPVSELWDGIDSSAHG